MKPIKPRVIVYCAFGAKRDAYYVGRIHDSVELTEDKTQAKQFTDEDELKSEWEILTHIHGVCPNSLYHSPGSEYANEKDMPKIESLPPLSPDLEELLRVWNEKEVK